MTSVAALILLLAPVLPPATQSEAARASETLVMPFENPQNEPRLYWLGEASSVLLTYYLGAFGAATVPRDARDSAFERLQLPPAASLSHATVIKVGQFVGASEVVIGTYELAADHLTVRTRLIQLDSGRLMPEVIERGPLSDLFAIYERTARRLHGRTAPLAPPPSRTIMASPQALEYFVKGLIAETPATQRAYLDQALKLAPDDDRIRIALWEVLTNLGDHLKALDAVGAVKPSTAHSRTARYLAALSEIDLKRYDQAFDILKALNAESRSAEVLNALGIVQLRRGSTPQTGKPAYYFNQASEADPTDPDYFFNLGYAYWLDRDPPAAIYWLREVLRLDPTDGDAHYVLGTALQHTSAAAEAAREKELARRLSSTYAEWEARASPSGDPVPRGLERGKDRLERPGRRVESAIATSGQRDQGTLAAFHLDAGRRAFEREADGEAERELRRALYLSPYLAEAHVLLGRIHLRSGRAAEAVQAFKIALWSEETVAAHLALAEAFLQLQNVPAASAEVDRALVLDPGSAEAQLLARRIGMPKPKPQ